ncbi:MAG TPA: type II toxin-antitoxin system RelE/ParE family toxin [Gemmataceae bacterium]|jgi:plasmid stabilization system protein ParE|nr:type II toxin-antitoxin system RelE/ParE family toxin [Gemmataceae bacterium]
MAYRFNFSLKAIEDAEAAYTWLAEKSPRSAAEWYVKLFEKIESLKDNPSRCSLAPESDAFSEEIRQLLYGKRQNIYRILFVVRRQVIQILRIRHAAMQLLDPKKDF